MARRAEGDQVCFRILAGVATKLFVVNLKIRHRTARLTPPAIATQHLLPQTFVRHRIQPQAFGSWTNRGHKVMRPSRSGHPEMPASALWAGIFGISSLRTAKSPASPEPCATRLQQSKCCLLYSRRPTGSRRTRIRFSSMTIMLPSRKGSSITGIAPNSNRN